MGRKRRDGEIGEDMLLLGVGLFPDGPKVMKFSVNEVRLWEERPLLHKSLGAASRCEGDHLEVKNGHLVSRQQFLFLSCLRPYQLEGWGSNFMYEWTFRCT